MSRTLTGTSPKKTWNWKAKANSKPWNGFQYPAETLVIEEALDEAKKWEKDIKTAAKAGKTDIEDIDHNKKSDDNGSGKDVGNEEEDDNYEEEYGNYTEDYTYDADLDKEVSDTEETPVESQDSSKINQDEEEREINIDNNEHVSEIPK